MYGAVPLRTIKETLLKHKAAGTLAKVKMVLCVPRPPHSLTPARPVVPLC